MWVAQGEYITELAPENCQSFTLSSGISLYGGFAGGETSPSQRPPGGRSLLTDGNCFPYVTVVVINSAQPVTLDGFTIGLCLRGIAISGPSHLSNLEVTAGVYYAIAKFDASPLSIANCSFFCSSSSGTPITLRGPGLISNSQLQANQAFGYALSLSDITIRDSIVSAGADSAAADLSNVVFDNCSVNISAGYSWAVDAEEVTFRNSVVNTSCSVGSAFIGGNIHLDGSALTASSSSMPKPALSIIGGSIRGSVVSASNQYAMALSGVPVVDSRIQSSGWLSLSGPSTFANTRFTGSGRISAALNQAAAPRFVNCLFQHNTTWPEHVIVVQPQWRFDNCIIWGNRDLESHIFNVPAGLTGFINHSIVRGWSGQYGGIGNSGADPLLDAAGRPQPGSPAIDAGSNAALLPQMLYDMAGNCRITDGDGNGTAIVDIGPFEVRPCMANCDCSTAAPVLNILDLVCFLQRFAAADPWANCDQSTTPPVLNIADFSCFLQQFAQGCP